MEMKKDYDRVIVNMATCSIYDFLFEGESVTNAKERGNRCYRETLERARGNYGDSDDDYWKGVLKSYEEEARAGCEVMSYTAFMHHTKKHLLDGKLTEVTEEKFNDALNVLPPLHWTTRNGVEMFCMSEMYIYTLTTQYAHDHRTGKYYSAMVDVKDERTWICELLEKKPSRRGISKCTGGEESDG